MNYTFGGDCRESEQLGRQAAEMQDELRSLQADHARLAEQYGLAQSCNAGLHRDLKACKYSLKQVQHLHAWSVSFCCDVKHS